MLGKLMKQEWLSTWKIPTVLISVAFAAATIFGLFWCIPCLGSDGLVGVQCFSATIFALRCIDVLPSWNIDLSGSTILPGIYSNEGYLTYTAGNPESAFT